MSGKKGKIIHVGEWDFKRDQPSGWTFTGADVGLQIYTDGRPPLIAGYTIDELRAIYQANMEKNA
jgi:hypothetical protein